MEIHDTQRTPLPGYTVQDAHFWHGDSLHFVAAWKTEDDGAELSGESIRLRFMVRDANLFAYHFEKV